MATFTLSLKPKHKNRLRHDTWNFFQKELKIVSQLRYFKPIFEPKRTTKDMKMFFLSLKRTNKGNHKLKLKIDFNLNEWGMM